MALPQKNRLKHWRDFREVYQRGIRCKGRYLALRGLRSSNSATNHANLSQQSPRIGISVSQKVSKKAVVRNRIKRQIRSILHPLLPRISPGWQLVIVVLSSAKGCEYAQFLRELEQLLAEAEVFDGY